MSKRPYRYTPAEPPLRRTALNDVHRRLGAKLAPFAGWEMPIQYPDGILAEHRAVRTAAGLFDVSHMRTLEIAGTGAETFLEVLLSNSVKGLRPGRAGYTVMFYPDGSLVDDLLVYRLERDRFMLVLNAANAERVVDWIDAVNSREVIIDMDDPDREVDATIDRPGSHRSAEDALVGLALQGPAARRAAAALADDHSDRAALDALKRNRIVPMTLAGIDLLVAATGYTGEANGIELFVASRHVVALWETLVERGRPLGATCAGLGARDSTRIEAGLPLFGHDLAGALDITPVEAGYAFVCRFDKVFFIGRSAAARRAASPRRHIIRLAGRGRRTVRPGHAVLDERGRPVGEVTSFAYVHEDLTFIVLACVSAEFSPEPGHAVTGVRVQRSALDGAPPAASRVDLTAMSRFPADAERAGWPTRYAPSG
ncbi:MAG TPA: hypothetical protein VMX57_09690 [Planctomycetota bacterium]|nr:hypothetical protein [Planctomycetota bacterium]